MRRIALVGSWADPIGDRRTIAAELAAAWSRDGDRVSVFADAPASTRELLTERSVASWPESAYGRHFSRDEFDHTVLMLGPRLDSLLALARSADDGAHVWLQDCTLDVDGSPIDAPDDWLSEVLSSARSVIVGSDRVAGVVRRAAPDGPPVLVMPPAHPDVVSVVDTPERNLAMVRGDDEVGVYLADRLGATLFRLDDDSMTPEVRDARLLSARAGIEIRSFERGFASTSVTHMTARGIPMITNLSAHAPFAGGDLTARGLVVLNEADDVLDRVVALLAPVLDDDRQWLAASTAAKATAASWTWTDAADVLAQWIGVVDDLERSTVRVVGAVPS